MANAEITYSIGQSTNVLLFKSMESFSPLKGQANANITHSVGQSTDMFLTGTLSPLKGGWGWGGRGRGKHPHYKQFWSVGKCVLIGIIIIIERG